MKKLFIFGILFSLFLIPGKAYALQKEEALNRKLEAQNRVEVRKASMEAKKAVVQERIQDKKASRASQLTEQRRTRLKFFFDRILTRLNAVSARLQTLIDRIASRLDKVEASNNKKDISEVQASLNEAQDLLTDINKDLVDLETAMDTVVNSENPKADMKSVRLMIQEIKSKFKEVHSILVHILGDIRGLRVGQYTPTVKLSPTVNLTPTSEPSPTEEPSPTPESL